MPGKLEQLQALLAPMAEALGHECWGIEFISQDHHLVLRVHIDRLEDVLIGNCEAASRQVSGILGVEDPIGGEYTLEVSSSGTNRLLFTLKQFIEHAGERVKIKLCSPYEGRRNYRDILRGMREQDVVALVDDHEYLLPADPIGKANIIPRFDQDVSPRTQWIERRGAQ